MARVNTNRNKNQQQKDKTMAQDTTKDSAAETSNTDSANQASDVTAPAETLKDTSGPQLNTKAEKNTASQEEVATIKAARSEDPLLKALATSLETYKETMAPKKPVESGVGVRQQQELYRTIVAVFSATDKSVFKQGKDLLVTFFSNNKKDGVMNDRYRLRFVNEWTLGEKSLNDFMVLLNMLDILTDKSITKKKQVFNTEEIINTSVNDAMSENLSEFLGPIS